MLGKCIFQGCTKSASFGPKESRIRLYCKTHINGDSVNVVNPTCIHPGCTTQSTYGTSDFKKMYCSVHKKDGMIHITKHRKVKTKENKEEDKENKKNQDNIIENPETS